MSNAPKRIWFEFDPKHPEKLAFAAPNKHIVHSADVTEYVRADLHGWQPIETAPKDGTVIILSGTAKEANFGGDRKEYSVVHQGYWSAKMWQMGTFDQWIDVTHWQPLPTPPIERTPK